MCLAVPGQIVSRFVEHDLPMGAVDFNGVRRDVCLSYLPDAAVGDYVVVHVGFALSRMDEAEARRTLALLDQLGALADEGLAGGEPADDRSTDNGSSGSDGSDGKVRA